MTLDRNAEKQEVPINPETGKPYINTLAAVAISPAGASPEKSTYVAQAVDVSVNPDCRVKPTPCSPTSKATSTTCSR